MWLCLSQSNQEEMGMGFLDKLKGTAKQAMSPGSQMATRDKIQKINASGVEGRATVDSMSETGTSFGGGHEIQFELTVHPATGEDYKVATSQTMHDATLNGIAQGGRVIVKIDPDDPQSLLVWGTAA
jgi:hypothetical protein